jgi:hypothetical protein
VQTKRKMSLPSSGLKWLLRMWPYYMCIMPWKLRSEEKERRKSPVWEKGKVNRNMQNCPLQDKQDDKGMMKWNFEKVPFCRVHHLKIHLINSITNYN